jgi:zinc resistance-associated protein
MRMNKLAVASLGLAGWIALSPVLAQSPAPRTPAPPADDVTIGDIYGPEEAAAVLEARLAALKAVIRLTPEQQKLWPAVEAAIRQVANAVAERGAQRVKTDPPQTFLDLVDRAADTEVARATDAKTVTAALRPLVASLSEAQRRRIPAFLGLREGQFGQAQPLAELWLFEGEQ